LACRPRHIEVDSEHGDVDVVFGRKLARYSATSMASTMLSVASGTRLETGGLTVYGIVVGPQAQHVLSNGLVASEVVLRDLGKFFDRDLRVDLIHGLG
jgi:hypothetical protein